MALIHTTFRSKMRFGRLSLLQYLLSANSVCISYFYFVDYIVLFLYAAFLCFLLCMFLLYITVLLPVGVIKDDRERKCADTIGTVLVPWTGHFQ